MNVRGVLLVVILCLTMSPIAAAEQVTITHMTYASHSESWHNYLYELESKFEALHPDYEVEILVEARPDEKYTVMLAGGQAPDVLDMTTSHAAPLLAEGMFMDLNTFIERDEEFSSDDYPQNVIDALTTPEGLLYLLPVEIYSIVTWYNLDMLSAAGLTPPVELGDGWTWEALREYGQKLTVDENGDGTNEVWGLDRMRARPYIQVRQAGGQYFDRDMFPTKSLLTSEPLVQGIEFIRQLIVEDGVSQPPGASSDTYWYSGGSAISVVDGPGIIGTRLADASFKWDVALQPMGPDNNATNISLNGFQISAATKHPQAAWEWVRFIGTGEEALATMARHTGRLPILADVARSWDSYVTNLPDHWELFFEQSLHPKNIFLKEAMVADDEIYDVLSTQLGRVWNGEVPTRAALSEAHRQITALLEK